MANIKSAMKRIRTSEKRRVRNAAVRSAVRGSVKSARAAIEAGQAAQARETLQRTIQTLDKAVTKGVIHKNTAARKKSRLTRQLNALASRYLASSATRQVRSARGFPPPVLRAWSTSRHCWAARASTPRACGARCTSAGPPAGAGRSGSALSASGACASSRRCSSCRTRSATR